MKYKFNKFPFNEFLKQHKLLFILLYLIFSLFIATIRKIKRRNAFKGNNIVIISLHRLGDSLFTIPAIKKIINYYSNNKIIIVCFPASVPIYKLFFNNIEFCLLEQYNFNFGGRIASSLARRKIALLKPNQIFDLTGTMKAASLIFNLRAKEIVGVNGKFFKKLYDKFVAFRDKPALIDNYLDVFSLISEKINNEDYINYTKNFNPNGNILMHPFASLKEKEWNLKKYIELAVRLNEQYEVNVISQSNHFNFDIEQEIFNLGINIIRSDSTEELINHIKQCSFFIGNDSGPINLANFLGKPTVTIYGSTNPDYTATETDHQVYIQNILECSARKDEKFCITWGDTYDCPGIQCMSDLSLENVYGITKPLIEKYCKKNNSVKEL